MAKSKEKIMEIVFLLAACNRVDSGSCINLHIPVCKRTAGNERNRRV